MTGGAVVGEFDDPQLATRPGPLVAAPRIGRLVLAVTVVVTVVLATVSTVAAVSRYQDERDQALAGLAERSEERAALMDQLLRSSFDQLGALASGTEISSGDPAQVFGSLSRFDGEAAGFTGGVAWTDAGGVTRVVTGQKSGLVGIDVKDRDWAVSALSGERFVGRAVVSRVLGRPVLPMAIPTRDDTGAINGVLSAGILLDRTGRMLGAVSGGRDVLIADRAGQIVVGEEPASAGLGEHPEAWSPTRYAAAGSAVGVTDPVGRADRVVSWSPVPSAGLSFIVSRPRSEVMGIAERDLAAAVVGIALLVVLLLVGGLLSGRMLDRRYRYLQAAAAQAGDEQRRSAVMAEAMAALASTETMSEVAEAVIDAARPLFGARAAGMSLIREGEPGHLWSVASSGWSEQDRQGWKRFPVHEALPVGDALIRARPVFVTATDLPDRYPDAAAPMLATGDLAWAALPLMDGTEPVGTLTASFDSADTLDAQTQLRLGVFAERVSNAIARVERQEAEHEVAVAFQRAVIPAHVPAIRGVQVEGHYVPASRANGIGGDWYDAIRVSDHSLMVVCGDIVGHGLTAAAAASRLRVVTATLAQTHRPAALLEHLDRIVDSDPDARYSSIACLLIDSNRRVIEYSVAGHPCPIKIDEDGLPEELSEGRGHLLGVTRDARPTGWAAWTDDCRSVLLYSDGLVERRGEPYDMGVQRLLDACTAFQVGPTTVSELADALIHETRIDDDITAVLVHLDTTQLDRHDRSSVPSELRLFR